MAGDSLGSESQGRRQWGLVSREATGGVRFDVTVLAKNRITLETIRCEFMRNMRLFPIHLPSLRD